MSLLASGILWYKGLANPSDVMSEALLRCAPFLSLEGFPPFVEQLSPNDCFYYYYYYYYFFISEYLCCWVITLIFSSRNFRENERFSTLWFVFLMPLFVHLFTLSLVLFNDLAVCGGGSTLEKSDSNFIKNFWCDFSYNTFFWRRLIGNGIEFIVHWWNTFFANSITQVRKTRNVLKQVSVKRFNTSHISQVIFITDDRQQDVIVLKGLTYDTIITLVKYHSKMS